MSVAVPSPDEERTASGLAVFRHRDFALFSGVRVAAGLAQQMQTVAVGWLVYDITQSALALGLVGLAGFPPAIALPLLTAHVADRFDRPAASSSHPATRSMPHPPWASSP